MSDRIEYIRRGFLVLLPVLDENGRAIIHGNFDPDLMGEELVDEVRIDIQILISSSLESSY